MGLKYQLTQLYLFSQLLNEVSSFQDQLGSVCFVFKYCESWSFCDQIYSNQMAFWNYHYYHYRLFFSRSLSYLTVKWSYVCDPISGCYWQLCKYTFLQRGNSTCAVPLFLSTMCCTADKRLETNVYSIFRQSLMAHCLTFICCFLLVLK